MEGQDLINRARQPNWHFDLADLVEIINTDEQVAKDLLKSNSDGLSLLAFFRC